MLDPFVSYGDEWQAAKSMSGQVDESMSGGDEWRAAKSYPTLYLVSLLYPTAGSPVELRRARCILSADSIRREGAEREGVSE